MAGNWSSVLILLLGVLSLCGRSTGQGSEYNFRCDLSPEEHSRILQEAKNKLQKDNYRVEDGVMRFIFPDGAFAANPTTPYGVYFFDNRASIPTPTWRLDEKDAIVFFGCTPPPAEYFSFRSYVFRTSQTLHSSIVFASLGDSTNNLVINTTGLNVNDPFGKTTVVTTTADIATDQSVRMAFTKAGVPDTAINTDIVPSSLVTLGQTPTGGTFTMLYRVAIYQDPAEGQAYIDTTWPVIRVSPTSQRAQLPFSTPPLRMRGTGMTEAIYSNSLSNLVKKVNETICAGPVRYSVTSDKMSVVRLEGRECIEENTNCLGDNRDAAYMNSSRRYRLRVADDSFFIVCGINHAMTGKATYSNFAVGNVIAVDNSLFGESARQYAPNMIDVDMFYAYKVARDCNGENFCLEVSTDEITGNQLFNFVARAYLEPPTKVGPDGSELLTPVVLHYSRRSRLNIFNLF